MSPSVSRSRQRSREPYYNYKTSNYKMSNSGKKSLQGLLIECALFVSLIAVIGHTTFNIYERCVVQKELSRMKTSLYTMKNTVHTISNAYDNLQRDLSRLSELSEQELYQDYHTHLGHLSNKGNSVPNELKKEVVKYDRPVSIPSKENALVETDVSPHLTDKTTLTRYPLKNVGTLKSVEKVERYTDYGDIADYDEESIDGSSSYAIAEYRNRNSPVVNNFRVQHTEPGRVSTKYEPCVPKRVEKYFDHIYASGDMKEDAYTSVSNKPSYKSDSFVSEVEFEEIPVIDESTSYNTNVTKLHYRQPLRVMVPSNKKVQHTRIAKFRDRRIQT